MDPADAIDAFTSDTDGVPLNITPLAVAQLSASDADRESDVSVKKRKRVRTGCFTCRDRHLKCDEALGQCQNCKKSGRLCRRGVRLNFVDTQVVAPPTCVTPPAGTGVTFRDDSRIIASEYVGGFERYPPPEQGTPLEDIRQASTPVQSGTNLFFRTQYRLSRHVSLGEPTVMSLMQVFVNQIGPWMDIVDEAKHFTRILPLYALEEPLLRAVIAACAGCYVSLHLSNEASERVRYYNTAALMLSDSLATLHRDPSMCAAAALIIEVTEMLVLGPIESGVRIRSSNSARSLIRECQWSTRTQGLGGACSWVSILMELLDCVVFRQTIVWDPDSWGIDMNFGVEPSIAGDEESWLQRIIYVCTKVSDLRSSYSKGIRKSTRHAEAQRSQQWSLYNEWCDRWFASIPRSLLPVGNVQPWQRNPQSVFPQVWLLGRSAIVAQMLYHIARIMLLELDSLWQDQISELQEEQQRHAYSVCGIVSNDRNNGIPVWSTQILSVAAGYLIDRKAQEEVVATLDHMRHASGLSTEHLRRKLQETWGWHSHEHQPYSSVVDTSIEFHPSDVGHEYPQVGVADPFSHSLVENHPYLDHPLNYD
ncbi:hypothetical protein BDW74DRAFT_153914 [Aspergillus multicolor]|uniref:Zn(II)2Cys6 transcription factor domain-containing protein n=1 Tax=Aspergillus multicolor TaxID=41759 RepID=UPI003CCDA3CA